MLFMFCGDLHGDLDAADYIIEIAKRNNIPEIIQVGDFGYVWPGDDTYAELSDKLVSGGISMRFCDGNHENLPFLFALPRTDNNLAPNITYQHRGTCKVYDNEIRVVFMGGAPSIDYRNRKTGVSWWPEERIQDSDVDAALSHGSADILVTHDAPVRIHGYKESSDMTFAMRAADSHDKISKVSKELSPSLHVHGHWHHRYDTNINGTHVIGLDANVGSPKDMWIIWDSESGIG